ncbi:MAG: molybdate ABC transporter permease subunit, partial [Acidimicrobiales bacterium]
MASSGAALGRVPAARRRGLAGLNTGVAFGTGLATLWLSLLVLLPLGAVVWRSQEDGASRFWDAVTTPEAAAAIRLTVGASLLVAFVNVVFGTLIAW